MRSKLNRRAVLLSISQIALVSPLVSCSRDGEETAGNNAQAGDTDLELLASVSYDLFPYPEIPAALYVRVGEHLLQSGNPAIAEGVAQLREATGNVPWKELDESLRISILTMLEETPFFAAVRAGSLEVLYRSEEVFAMVGYGGSAIEHGGYINRGFDEIDWLPEGEDTNAR